ncbi:MAG: hypothetical protein L0338_34645 [Acidobacteria bacterium]|nr:hypothetical protein [Acidobacteriota bacterium]
MTLTNMNDDRLYFTSMLLDEGRNVWVGVEFVRLLREVFQRLSLPVLKQLAEGETVFLAPDANILGRTFTARVDPDERIVVHIAPNPLSPVR